MDVQEIRKYVSGMDQFNTYKPSKYVKEFFETDVLPRYIKMHPNASEEELNLVKNGYDHNLVKLGFELEPTVMGAYCREGKDTINPYQTYNKEKILYNPRYSLTNPLLVHEFTHRYRLGLLGNKYKPYGYTNEETKYLNKGYNFHFNNNSIDHATDEEGTTNAEIRYRIWRHLYDVNNKAPTVEEVNNYIDSLTPSLLHDFYSGVNLYIQADELYDFLNTAIKEIPKDILEQLNKLIELKYVIEDKLSTLRHNVNTETDYKLMLLLEKEFLNILNLIRDLKAPYSRIGDFKNALKNVADNSNQNTNINFAKFDAKLNYIDLMKNK